MHPCHRPRRSARWRAAARPRRCWTRCWTRRPRCRTCARRSQATAAASCRRTGRRSATRCCRRAPPARARCRPSRRPRTPRRVPARSLTLRTAMGRAAVSGRRCSCDRAACLKTAPRGRTPPARLATLPARAPPACSRLQRCQVPGPERGRAGQVCLEYLERYYVLITFTAFLFDPAMGPAAPARAAQACAQSRATRSLSRELCGKKLLGSSGRCAATSHALSACPGTLLVAFPNLDASR